MSGAAELSGLAYWLPLIAAGAVALGVLLYVVLDGFDLGIGILFPFFKQESERDQMMNSVAPFWDGNETWLILGGNGLFVAFPMAYAIIMPALYAPLIAMLLALVFRGVAFEFRWVAKPHHRKWDIAFASGSLVAAFAQGVMLGALIDGIRIENRQFAGDALDCISAFSLTCGFGVTIGYALIGVCWLVMKTSGAVERQARRYARPLLIAMLVFIALVSIWTPLQYPHIASLWFGSPNIFYLSPVPLITAALAVLCWRGIAGRHPSLAFYSAVGFFVVSFIGLAISIFPYLAPFSVDLWTAAAPVESQTFILTGMAVLLPFILGYTVFVYYTFRGKIREGSGYH